MASLAGSIIGWSYLPTFATRQLLPYFHKGYSILFRRPPPAPETPEYRQHYRYVYAIVVLSYLFYNFREAALSMPPNYYEILGVSPNSDPSTLKSAFRQFAKKHHPDRVGPQGETLFIEVRDAFEALKNPVTRFAYDRFGPQALTWQNCTTLRDYVRHGLMNSAGYHVVSLCALFLYSAIGQPSPVSFWRYVLFGSLFAYELVFLLRPSPSAPSISTLSPFLFTDPSSPSHNSIFGFLWPNRVAYQHIKFLHSLFMMCSVAISRVAPVLFPTPLAQHMDQKKLISELGVINQLVITAEAEASSMIQTDLHSCHGEPTGVQPTGASFPHVPPLENPAEPVLSLLSTQMENMIVEGKLLKESEPVGPLQTAAQAAAERLRHRIEQQKQQQTLRQGRGFAQEQVARAWSTPLRRAHAGRSLESPLTPVSGWARARSQSL